MGLEDFIPNVIFLFFLPFLNQAVEINCQSLFTAGLAGNVKGFLGQIAI